MATVAKNGTYLLKVDLCSFNLRHNHSNSFTLSKVGKFPRVGFLEKQTSTKKKIFDNTFCHLCDYILALEEKHINY